MVRNYFDLTIKEYLKIKTISELETDETQRDIKLYAALTGMDLDKVKQLSVDEISKVNQILAVQDNKRVRLKVKVNGKRFKFIWREQEMTADQFIDATFFCSKDDQEQNMHNILASFAVECNWYGKSKPYNGSNHQQVAQIFYEHMKLQDAYPLLLFFCNYYKELSHATLIYMAENRELWTNFIANGGGLHL